MAQSLTESINGHWKIDYLIGCPDGNRTINQYHLTEITNDQKQKWHYGNNLIVNNDFTFRCAYYAPCGNGCFPSSIGQYEIIDQNHIKLFLDKVYQKGMCEHFEKELHQDLGVFLVEKTENGLKLSKTNSLKSDIKRH
ncbi:hypothetical protein [Neisseria sp. Ec49-e6-T10]|uniref:hypothetical protein n=1 Tax=Neisseria sp. Ec49-e6-T10 TaxID=3140744 RepID=UPI003EBE3F36